MSAAERFGLKTAADLEEEQTDFESDGEQAWCKHCGVVKEASAKFFIDHYRECVEPRRKLNEREETNR